MRRVPTVISLDATPVNFDTVGRYYAHRPAAGSLFDRQAHRLNRRVFHAAAGLVTWSEWVRQSLTDHYGVAPTRVRVLAPGAAAAYFDIGERRVSRAAAGQRADGPARVLFVGGDFERKGGTLLLECMDGALAEHCELHLVTKEPVAPRRNVYVHYGLRPNSAELLQLFAAADIFVLPTYADCLAVVLMEATAAGLPVITTDVGALGEAVRPGESGLLIRPGDGQALRSALERLVGDPNVRERMGRAGYLLARQKFDARQNNRALLDLVVELGMAGRGLREAA
jgi:glycosyltransferase involved in cell wall biosynthesis